MNKKVVRKRYNQWLKDLRSGEFKQTKATLRDPAGMCCLGVLACRVAKERKKSLTALMRRVNASTLGKSTSSDSRLVAFAHDMGLTVSNTQKLMDMNDGNGKSFGQIADYIEAYIMPKVLNA